MKKYITIISLILFLGGSLSLSTSASVYAQGNDQNHTVSGLVTSAQDGEPLPGVNITVKGTTTGTSTNPEGRYSLTVPSASDTLVFSFVGFESREVPINGQDAINVALNPGTVLGEELLVVGYGAQEKRDITGSVSSVSADKIAEVPVTDAAQALQGRAAGVMVANDGNRPGDGVTVRIRGRRSLTASNDPLYVVDGIPLSGGINDINPNNIESMEVLKDASATAIYGSRGANGVILITTKRGGNHQTLVSYDGYFGVSRELEHPDYMTGSEFAELRRQANRTIGEWSGPGDDPGIFTGTELDAIQNGRSYDYVDLVTQDAGYQQNHQLSVQGGNEKTRFAVSGSFFNEDGLIRGQNYNRYTVRVNLDHNISDKFRIGTSTLLSQFDQAYGTDPYGRAMSMNPLGNPYNPDGTPDFRPTDDGLISNPLNDLIPGKMIDDRTRLRVFSNIFGIYDFSDNLSYRLNFGPDIQSYRRGIFQGTNTGARGEGVPYAEKSNNRTQSYTLENILTYQQSFSDVHEVELTGLYSLQTERFETDTIAVSDLPYEGQQYHNLGTANTVEKYQSYMSEWGIMSFMGRVNYQYNDKYLFTVTGRADGSSRLAEGRKWGFFPSAAVGWRIIDESFMADQSLFSDLKLRVSYGVTGNTAIDPYQTQSLLTRTVYAFGEQPGFGYRPGQIPNELLQWETSRQLNIGLEFGLWNNRMAGSVEVYQTNTSDMLLERQLPITSGYESVFENVGKTRNRGIEIAINTQNIASRTGFNWTTDLNFFANSEEIVDLYGNEQDDVGNEWFIGQPLTVWYDYEKIGIWQEDEAAEAASHGQEPGEIKVRDQNNDGMINEQDRIIHGTDMPDFSIGLANHFSYNGVDLSIFLYGSFGQTIYNEFNTPGLYARYNGMNVDYWTPENPTNAHPRPNVSQEDPIYSSTRGYMDGSFVKVRNVRLGYTFPSQFTQNLSIQSLRVYINAESPLVFSKLDNIDPERYGGVINADQPNTSLYTVGVNINF